MAVAPETRLRCEFPYLNKMPEDHILDNPYLDSLIYEAASLYSSSPNSPSRLAEKQQSTTVADGVGSFDSDESKSVYQKPFHAAQVIEPRLTTADISYWTTVCNDNALMRNLLAVFFRCEFNFAAAFQKDYFLEDLAAQRKDFCSSLLVNIILAYSCVCVCAWPTKTKMLFSFLFFFNPSDSWVVRPATPNSQIAPSIGTPKRSPIGFLWKPNENGSLKPQSHASPRYNPGYYSAYSITSAALTR